MSYLDLFGLVLVFLVLVIVTAVSWAAGAAHGETVGRNQVADAEAVARAARNSKPGDLIPCRDPRAVAEAMRNGSTLGSLFFDGKGHAYRLPASPREEIALALLLRRCDDETSGYKNMVASCFELADEFIKQADGRDA